MSFGGEFYPAGRLDSDWFMCRTCGRRLNTRRNPDGSIAEFLHTFQEDDDDHKPDAVPEREMEHPSKIVCDFCGREGVAWSYPCRTFGHRGHRSIGDWAACDTCSTNIEANDMAPILDRQIDSLVARNQLSPKDPSLGLVRTDIALFHRKFMQHRRGPRQAVGPR